MRKFKPHVVPPRGFHYPVTPDVILQGADWRGLFKLITNWRIANHMPVGDPEKDVLDYFEKAYPYALDYAPGPELHKEDGVTPQVDGDDLNRLTQATGRLYTEMPQGGYGIVPDAEANERAKLCARCPYHKTMPVSCASCWAAIMAQIHTIRNGKVLVSDGEYGMCTKTGNPVQAIAFIKKDEVKCSQKLKDALWSCCWVK